MGTSARIALAPAFPIFLKPRSVGPKALERSRKARRCRCITKKPVTSFSIISAWHATSVATTSRAHKHRLEANPGRMAKALG
jgi:hypothetical protein